MSYRNLLKLPYAIKKARTQWVLVIEQWMMDAMRLERVYGVSQMFVKSREYGPFQFILVILQTIYCSQERSRQWKNFRADKNSFNISKSIIDGSINFNRCHIKQFLDVIIYMYMV